MPIKSVHITNYYHKNSGGISTAYNAILDAAARHERYVRLIVPGEKKEIEEINKYARIYYIPARYSPVFDKRYRLMMPWDYMLHGTALRDALVKEQPDMVEIRDKYTLSLFGAMVRRNMFSAIDRPMLVSFSSERMSDNISSFLIDGKFSNWLSRRVMGNYNFPSFDFHIANSKYTAEEFYNSVREENNPKRNTWFLNFCWRFLISPRVHFEERIKVCPTGINNARFSPKRRSVAARKKIAELLNIPDGSEILLYSGRISPEKNVELLPDIMEVLIKEKSKNFILLVAGSGPKADWLKLETEKRVPGKIILLGHLDKDILADHYANADVFIHTNPKEPYGLVPLEAMASGVPTVLPNSGGVLSYANHENSWLAEPNARDFAKKIVQALDDRQETRRKVQNALETVKENTFEKFTDRLFQIYDELYEDFQNRNELFTDRKAVKKFDFTKLTK